MRFRPLLAWLIFLTLLSNMGLNLFVLHSLSRIYTINDDFRADIVVRSIQKKVEADNIKLPPIKIIKLISAHPRAKPSQMFFTGEDLLIFVNLVVLKDLSEPELRAVIGHEVGHYVLGHRPDFASYAGVVQNSYEKEMQADLFALKYSSNAAVYSAVMKLVWNEDEKSARLAAIENK